MVSLESFFLFEAKRFLLENENEGRTVLASQNRTSNYQILVPCVF
jgi:hypothetical protein